MRRLGLTHLVAKNSGGDAAKLDAAAALGLGGVMVARPAPPPGPVAAGLGEAIAWLAATLDSRRTMAER
jgi:precorrin-6A/cobalt-precorrin-6A reductase